MQLGDAGLSITKIYTVSFVGQARLYLRILLVEEFGSEARRFPRIAMRYGVKSNNFSTKKNTGKTGSRLPVCPRLGKIDFVRYFSVGISFDILHIALPHC